MITSSLFVGAVVVVVAAAVVAAAVAAAAVVVVVLQPSDYLQLVVLRGVLT